MDGDALYQRLAAMRDELDEILRDIFPAPLADFPAPGPDFDVPFEPVNPGLAPTVWPERPDGLASRFCPRSDQHEPHQWDDVTAQEDCWCEGIPF